MSLPARTDRAKALARTYGGDRDGWTRVDEYQRVLEYAAAHPDAGSTAVSNALDLPRGRIRPWLNGSKPDPAHAVDTAEANGWLDAAPGERTFEALSLLTAWILAGGSIDRERFAPHLSAGADDPTALGHECFQAVGLDSERLERDGRHGAELRPVGDGGTHLGRFLHAVMGAPVGGKGAQLQLPGWLDAVPPATRTRWVQLYVRLRGVTLPNGRLQLQERRSAGYRRALGELVGAVLSDPSVVSVGAVAVRIDASHVALVDVVPELPE